MYNKLPEQPLGVLDLTGLSFRFWRMNMGGILRFLLVPSLLLAFFGTGTQWLMSYGMQAVTQSKNLQTGLTVGVAGFFVGIGWLICCWWLFIRLLALVRLSLGFSQSLEDANRYMQRRKWSLVGIYALLVSVMVAISIVWVGIIAIGFVVPGTAAKGIAVLLTMNIGGWGLFGTILLIMLVLNLAVCILACEDEPVMAIFGRSFRMAFKHLLRTVGFAMVFAVVFFAVSMPLSLPIAALTMFDYMQHGVQAAEAHQTYQPPLYVMVASQSWEMIIGMLLRPLTFLAWGYFYYDLRMRAEGLDLKRKLFSLEQKVA